MPERFETVRAERREDRPTAHQRGYTKRWDRFIRATFPGLLVRAGVLPVCGAALPGGPSGQGSRCKQAGKLTFTSERMRLHGDHEPPLTPQERLDPRVVCDPYRIQLLCASCHNAKDDVEPKPPVHVGAW